MKAFLLGVLLISLCTNKNTNNTLKDKPLLNCEVVFNVYHPQGVGRFVVLDYTEDSVTTEHGIFPMSMVQRINCER